MSDNLPHTNFQWQWRWRRWQLEIWIIKLELMSMWGARTIYMRVSMRITLMMTPMSMTRFELTSLWGARTWEPPRTKSPLLCHDPEIQIRKWMYDIQSLSFIIFQLESEKVMLIFVLYYFFIRKWEWEVQSISNIFLRLDSESGIYSIGFLYQLLIRKWKWDIQSPNQNCPIMREMESPYSELSQVPHIPEFHRMSMSCSHSEVQLVICSSNWIYK